MVRLTVVTLLGICLSAAAQGQSDAYEWQGSTTLKLQGGLAFSSMNWKGSGNERLYRFNAPSLYLSAGIDYFDRRRFNLSTNIGYICKGGINKYTGNSPSGIEVKSDRLRLSYVTLNTTFDYKILADRFATPFVSVGPRVDYLAQYSKEALRNLDEHNNLNRIMLGINLGLGIKYSVERIELGFRGDYLFNCDRVGTFTNDLDKTLTTVQDKTYVFSLSCGYHLGH